MMMMSDTPPKENIILIYNENTHLISNDIIPFIQIRSQDTLLWKKIKSNIIFQKVFSSLVGIGTTTGFIIFVLPTSLLLGSACIIGFTLLGLSSPMLISNKASKIWHNVKNKLIGKFTDLAVLPKVTLLTPLAFQPNISFDIKEQRDKILVFVHGFLHNKSCWVTLSKKIIKDMKNNDNPITEQDIYAINLGEPITIKSIEIYAHFLATKLDQIRTTRNLEKLKVIIVSHSMGGLVSAFFAIKFAEQSKIEVIRLIANGTPWDGTPMANLSCWSKCGQEMIPNHDLQIRLKNSLQQTHVQLRERIFTIASKGDTIVPFISASGINLNLPKENMIFLKYPLGHLAMLESEQTNHENIRLIKSAWNL